MFGPKPALFERFAPLAFGFKRTFGVKGPPLRANIGVHWKGVRPLFL